MASQQAFIIIEVNYFSYTLLCSISINFIVLSLQNHLSFLYIYVQLFYLSLYHNHYHKCLPVKAMEYINMVLKAVQLNLLIFPVVWFTS